MKPSPLHWPDGVPRFDVRRADDRRWFIWDMLHERRATLLMVCKDTALQALHECERAASRNPKL